MEVLSVMCMIHMAEILGMYGVLAPIMFGVRRYSAYAVSHL
jgi:hypothetical protein